MRDSTWGELQWLSQEGPTDSANIALIPPVTILPVQVVHKQPIDSATNLFVVNKNNFFWSLRKLI